MHGRVARLLELLAHVAGPRLPVAPAPERLIECRGCRSACVVPVEWHERGELRWWIRLRCGECGLLREVEATNAQVARFERELDAGVAVIAAAIERAERPRMLAGVAALSAALERDLIDASDFRTAADQEEDPMTPPHDQQARAGRPPADPADRPSRRRRRDRPISPRRTDVGAVIVIISVVAIILMIVLA